MRDRYRETGSVRDDDGAKLKIELASRNQKRQILSLSKVSNGSHSDDEEKKRNPKKERNERLVAKALRRRQKWVDHQVDELEIERELEAQFRKGQQTDKSAANHNFRPFSAEMRGVRHAPRTRRSDKLLMSSPHSGKADRFINKTIDSGSKPDKVRNK